MTGRKKRLDSALSAIKINRIAWPIAIGLVVVSYLLWKQFDIEEFKNVNWDVWTFSWILLGIGFYVIRHLSYAYRLMGLSDGKFAWKKAIELIFIWEFATAVSPTSLGGSAVALVLLAQEKIKAAKTVTIVLYSVVLDTFFFLATLPVLVFLLGFNVIRPGMRSLYDIDGYGITFLAVFLAMAVYGFIFFYGLFYRPDHIKNLLLYLSGIKFLSRFKASLERTAHDIVKSSKKLKKKSVKYHLQAILSTFSAWFFKFALMACLIYGLVKTVVPHIETSALIYGRYETMFAITMFSPTPGGSGLAEFLFGGFYSDMVPISLAVIIALCWRMISYYSYLFIGVVIVPAWIKSVVRKRSKHKSLELV